MPLLAPLAEMPFPRIDPVAFEILGFQVRWYGISYLVAFGLAYLVLRDLARRGRWPVPPDRVGDVLFWGILGVFLGGRAGYMLFYASDKSLPAWFHIREGGMAFHGGLLGVVLAYVVYAIVKRVRFRDLGDGLALATPLGIFSVRLANFVNAELWGRPWDGPWAVRFPLYRIQEAWDGRWDTVTRHPSQLYQALGEGLLTFLILRWLMLGRGWGGGRVAAAFVFLYGAFRFVAEFFREPDRDIGYDALGLTRGQEFCLGMVVIGIVAMVLLRRSRPMPPPPWAKPAASRG
jgi:phosphatidylglycerol:prolipoprotein diacylglycerol transferase